MDIPRQTGGECNLMSGPDGQENLPTHLIHQRLELINILKATVRDGKAHTGYLAEFFELPQLEPDQ
jgi:hypothetical protein